MSTHSCPGGCGLQVPQHQLSCKRCWFTLPKPMRDDINAAYRQRAADPVAHRRLVVAALSWYRDNRPGEAA